MSLQTVVRACPCNTLLRPLGTCVPSAKGLGAGTGRPLSWLKLTEPLRLLSGLAWGDPRAVLFGCPHL